MQTEHGSEAAFSFEVKVRKLPGKGYRLNYVASAEVCRQLATDYDLTEVSSFAVEGNITPCNRQTLRFVGAVCAKIIQPCAITGDPLNQNIREEMDITFVQEGSRSARQQSLDGQEVVVDLLEEDLPEVYSGDSIDLAPIWLEHFVLGIDPFAHLDDAVAEVPELQATDDSPFSVLRSLKNTTK